MAPPLRPTSYAVLGMLSLAPMSGYELTRNVDKTIAHFWTISKSQVYGELTRLEEEGFVRGTNVAQERVPDKRIYEMTDAGAQALDGWLAGGVVDERSRLRSGHLLKLFFALRMGRDEVEDLLARYEADARAARDRLATIVELLEGPPEAFFPRATALVGLRSAEGTLAALDEIRATLPAPRAAPASPAAIQRGARELLTRTPARNAGRGTKDRRS